VKIKKARQHAWTSYFFQTARATQTSEWQKNLANFLRTKWHGKPLLKVWRTRLHVWAVQKQILMPHCLVIFKVFRIKILWLCTGVLLPYIVLLVEHKKHLIQKLRLFGIFKFRIFLGKYIEICSFIVVLHKTKRIIFATIKGAVSWNKNFVFFYYSSAQNETHYFLTLLKGQSHEIKIF
jgi:hypothetical protein